MIKALFDWLGLDKKVLTAEQEFLLVLASLTVFAIFPFSIYRFFIGDWLMGSLDLLMVICSTSASLYALKIGKARIMSFVFWFVLAIGFVFVVAVTDKTLLYWSFPVGVSSYFILRLKEAVWGSALILVSALAFTYQQMSVHEATTFTITFVLVSLFSYLFADRKARENRMLTKQAMIDSLTGAGNRRALDDYLELQVSVTRKRDEDTVVMLFDIDHFKQINDQFGHSVGDQFLVRFVELFQAMLQPGEKLYRYGGEEFAAVVKGNQNDAVVLAEYMRQSLEKSMFIPDYPVTTSIGMAVLKHGEKVREWVKRADDALYLAKSSGRNQVQMDSLSASPDP